MNYQKIKLLNGLEVQVDMSARRAACRKCKKLIRFGITPKGKYIPIIEKTGGWDTHFADCEFADEFRKSRVSSHVEDQQKNEEELSKL
jgi:hypothetical protein